MRHHRGGMVNNALRPHLAPHPIPPYVPFKQTEADMRVAALVLGIIAGLWGMMVGFFSWGWIAVTELEGADRYVDAVANPEVLKVAGLLAPILAIAGGAMALSKPRLAGIFLLISAAGMFYAFGFHFWTMFAISMAAVAGLLALASGDEAA